MKTDLNHEALDKAFEAYWQADGGTFKGIEAAISAYLAAARQTEAERQYRRERRNDYRVSM